MNKVKIGRKYYNLQCGNITCVPSHNLNIQTWLLISGKTPKSLKLDLNTGVYTLSGFGLHSPTEVVHPEFYSAK